MSKLTKIGRYLRRHLSLRCEDLDTLYSSQWPIHPTAYVVYRVIFGCYVLATWIQTTTFYLTHELVIGKHNIFAFVTTWVYTLSAVHFILATIATIWFTYNRPSMWPKSELKQSRDTRKDVPCLKYVEHPYVQQPLERNSVHCNGAGTNIEKTPFKRRRARSEGEIRRSEKSNMNLFQIANNFRNIGGAVGARESTQYHQPYHAISEIRKADCFTIDIEPIDYSYTVDPSQESQKYSLAELNPKHLHPYLENGIHNREINPFTIRRFSLPSRNSNRWRRLREELVPRDINTDLENVTRDTNHESTSSDDAMSAIFLKHTASGFLKFSWILYEMSFTLLIAISIFYFALVLPHIIEVHNYKVDFQDASVHGVNTFLIIIDFTISAYPVRLLHFVFAQIFAVIYVVFSVIFWRADPSFNIIYDIILDWEKEWPKALGICAGLVLAAIPILHIAHFGLYKIKLSFHRRLTS